MDSTKLEKGVVDRNSDEAKDRYIWGVAGGTKGGVDRAERTCEGIASTIQVDRDGEIVLPSAFKARLSKFESGSSPFGAGHLHRPADANPTQIGWVMEVRIEKHRVPCTFRFSETTAAGEWWKLASDPKGKGIMFSIGFIPIRWVYGTVADLVKEFPEIREAVREAGLHDEDKLRVYTEIELLEISAVFVGSNREALQLLAAKALVAGEGAEEAMAKFSDELAAKVVERLKAAGLLPADVLDEIKEQLVATVVVITDKVNELMDTITLSSDPHGHETQLAAPPAGETPPDADESDKDGASKLKAAAGRLQQAAQS